MSESPTSQRDAVGDYFGFRTPSRYRLTRFVFLRALGVIYFFSFLTMLRQWRPLLGAHGLLPVPDFLHYVASSLGSRAAGFWRLPSLFWLASSDAWLTSAAWLGLLSSLLLIAGFANAPLLALLWLLHLSFIKVG